MCRIIRAGGKIEQGARRAAHEECEGRGTRGAGTRERSLGGRP